MPTLASKVAKMARGIRARFTKGKIEPLEEVDFDGGEEIRVIIPERPKGKGMIEALRASASGWKDLIDGEELRETFTTTASSIPVLTPSYEVPRRF